MIPFRTLLTAELRKTVSTRAARVLLAVALLAAMAAEAIPLVFPHSVTQDHASYLTWAALGLSRLLPIMLMMAMTAEWSQRTALTTFTLEPRRGRVLAAKVTAGLLIAVACGIFALAVGTVTAGLAPHVTGGEDWAAVAGTALFVLLTSAIGIAVGAALHNTAAAIVTYFAVAGAASLLMIPALARAGDWINTGQTFGWVLAGQWTGHTAQILVSAALWIALPLTIGTARTLRRDVVLTVSCSGIARLAQPNGPLYPLWDFSRAIWSPDRGPIRGYFTCRPDRGLNSGKIITEYHNHPTRSLPPSTRDKVQPPDMPPAIGFFLDRGKAGVFGELLWTGIDSQASPRDDRR